MATVTTLNDIVDPNDGLISLREALASGGSADFDSSLSGGTINLKSTLLVDKTGASAIDAESRGGNITISGGNFDLIDVVGTSLSLSGLTLKGGSDAVELSGIGSTLSLNLVNIVDSRDDGIDVRGPGSKITFQDSIIANAGDDGISFSNAANSSFFSQNGSIDTTGDEGIEVRNSDRLMIELYDGFSIANAGSDGVDIRSNDIKIFVDSSGLSITNSGSDAVELRDSDNAEITLNGSFRSNGDDGIDIQHSDNANVLLNNTSIENTGDEGIAINDSDQMSLTAFDVVIDGAGGDGIDLSGRGRSSLNLTNPVIQNNRDNGINAGIDEIDIVINGGLIANNGGANMTLRNTATTAVSIFGTAGNDILNGSDVVERFDGGEGNDVLTGAERADVFGFSPNSGVDTITDFELGRDLINVMALGITDFTDIVLQGNTVLFDVINGGQVDLLNVDVSRLSEADFIFA